MILKAALGEPPSKLAATPTKKSTAPAGVVLSVIVLAAIASIGYFQFQVAPTFFKESTTTTSTGSSNIKAVNVTIPAGAGVPPAGSPAQFGFSPLSLTVVIGVNNTVNWVNDDTAPHTATSDTAGVFDTGTIAPGSIGTATITQTGTFTYHCSFHSWMKATITVKAR